jgi:hypothetical protein
MGKLWKTPKIRRSHPNLNNVLEFKIESPFLLNSSFELRHPLGLLIHEIQEV